jgi:hypothetical protein
LRTSGRMPAAWLPNNMIAFRRTRRGNHPHALALASVFFSASVALSKEEPRRTGDGAGILEGVKLPQCCRAITRHSVFQRRASHSRNPRVKAQFQVERLAHDRETAPKTLRMVSGNE